MSTQDNSGVVNDASTTTSESSFYNVREENSMDSERGMVNQHTFNVNLEKECPKLEIAYKACFDDWYSNTFLKGKGVENGCRNEWEDLRACMLILVNDKTLEVSIEKGEKESEWKIKNLE